MEQFVEVSDEEGKNMSESDSLDDEYIWIKEFKDQYKKLRREVVQVKYAEYMERKNVFKFYEIKDGVDLDSKDGSQKKLVKKFLGERL